MPKTERLVIKILQTNKRELESIAQAEGEPVAVIVRRMLRDGVQRANAQQSQMGAAPAAQGVQRDA